MTGLHFKRKKKKNKINSSKSKEERQIPCGITYVWTLKHDPNDTIYETESRTQRAD